MCIQLRDAWPGKAQKMLKSRNRGAGGDGKKLKTSNKVPGADRVCAKFGSFSFFVLELAS